MQVRCKFCFMSPFLYSFRSQSKYLSLPLYHINPGTLTKKNNTCAVFIEERGEAEDVGVLRDEGEEGQSGREL